LASISRSYEENKTVPVFRSQCVCVCVCDVHLFISSISYLVMRELMSAEKTLRNGKLLQCWQRPVSAFHETRLYLALHAMYRTASISTEAT